MIRSILRTLVLAGLTLTLSGCSDDSPATVDSVQPALELRVYPVDGQSSAEIARVINHLLTGPSMEGTADQVFLGRVRALPNGDLAILAAESVHEDVEELIESALETRSPSVSADLQFWLVRAERSETTSIAGTLASLEDALIDVTDQTGPLSFELVEHLRQRTDVQERPTSIRGAALYANLSQRVVDEEALMMDLNLRAPDFDLSASSEITLRSGETVLLAQTGSQGSDSVFIFVVRADLL